MSGVTGFGHEEVKKGLSPKEEFQEWDLVITGLQTKLGKEYKKVGFSLLKGVSISDLSLCLTSLLFNLGSGSFSDAALIHASECVDAASGLSKTLA